MPPLQPSLTIPQVQSTNCCSDKSSVATLPYLAIKSALSIAATAAKA